MKVFAFNLLVCVDVELLPIEFVHEANCRAKQTYHGFALMGLRPPPDPS